MKFQIQAIFILIWSMVTAIMSLPTPEPNSFLPRRALDGRFEHAVVEIPVEKRQDGPFDLAKRIGHVTTPTFLLEFSFANCCFQDLYHSSQPVSSTATGEKTKSG